MRTLVALGGAALLLSITEPLASLAVGLKLVGLLLLVPFGTSILRKPRHQRKSVETKQFSSPGKEFNVGG
jgi:hypothetical protein